MTSAECQKSHCALPTVCVICEDGGSECAHWSCIQGSCVGELCPPKVFNP